MDKEKEEVQGAITEKAGRFVHRVENVYYEDILLYDLGLITLLLIVSLSFMIISSLK